MPDLRKDGSCLFSPTEMVNLAKGVVDGEDLEPEVQEVIEKVYDSVEQEEPPEDD